MNMKLKQKYIKCFTHEKSAELKLVGYKYLYESDGIFYFEDNQDLTIKFSNINILKDTKSSSWIGL